MEQRRNKPALGLLFVRCPQSAVAVAAGQWLPCTAVLLGPAMLCMPVMNWRRVRENSIRLVESYRSGTTADLWQQCSAPAWAGETDGALCCAQIVSFLLFAGNPSLFRCVFQLCLNLLSSFGNAIVIKV